MAMIPDVPSILHAVRQHADAAPDAPALSYVDAEGTETRWSRAELVDRAARVATRLRLDLEEGDRVLLLYPPGLDAVAALLGCVWGGVVGVPMQPPGGHRTGTALARLTGVVEDNGAKAIATVTDLVDALAETCAERSNLAALPRIPTDAVDDAPARPVAIGREDLAYLQYTSGSTSKPKGVMITHDDLLVNLTTFDEGYGHDADSVMVSWLPSFHDLGLVYGVLMPLVAGFHGVLLSPLDVIQRPMRWLEAIQRFGGTHSPAPDYAYGLTAAKVSEEEAAALDLTTWRVALNGAEPIRRKSEAAFVARFASAGVTWRTLSHAYGMSETTAVISKEPADTGTVFLELDADALAEGTVAEPGPETSRVVAIAGCGVPTAPTTVQVVDPETCAPVDGVGEIWVGGPTRAQGYWNQPEATRAAFFATTTEGDGPWFRTGDLGFVRDGVVFVTGRLKDLIIVRGENLYPQDVEWAAQDAHPAVRPGGVAALGWDDGDHEALVVVAEVDPEREDEAPEIARALADATARLGVRPDHLVLVPPRAILKTSSGKVMRAPTLAAWQDDTLKTWFTWTPSESLPAPAPTPAPDPDAGRAEAGVADDLATRVAAVLGVPVDAVDRDLPFRDLGLDSVAAVSLTETLSTDLGRDLPATLLFDHPTIAQLADHLAGGAATADAASAEPAPAKDDDLGDLDEAELRDLLSKELEDL